MERGWDMRNGDGPRTLLAFGVLGLLTLALGIYSAVYLAAMLLGH